MPKKFAMTRTCAECPWLKSSPVGHFPRSRYKALERTCEPGGYGAPIFACHMSKEGGEVACAGMLLVEGPNVNMVRMAALRGAFEPDQIEASGPLFDSYAEMAKANGWDVKRQRYCRVKQP